jgi:hypothetical protein
MIVDTSANHERDEFIIAFWRFQIFGLSRLLGGEEKFIASRCGLKVEG